MIKALPGTTIELDIAEWKHADRLLEAMFLSGGLVLSQAARLAGLAPHDIQNWVRRGFVSSPRRKRYSRSQLSRIFIINMLRGSLQLDQVCALLGYINGDLTDEGDDCIDDTSLYLCLVRLCLAVEYGELADISAVLADYEEPYPGAGKKLARILEIMVTAYQAASLRQRAEDMIIDLDIDGRC
jgi:DNA-binding transcriptional MerR regulator